MNEPRSARRTLLHRWPHDGQRCAVYTRALPSVRSACRCPLPKTSSPSPWRPRC
ncbi:hypothetical protein [Pseudomonas sediminis]|uniref:hypothetical protein n=1 Tax=Pseudomonas sediminis TaxID=1691904 RepID=UPI003D2F0105